MDGPAAAARAQPSGPAALFWAFTRLALQGFGGVLAVAQRELVERLGWLSKAEFVELLAIAQVLPGPNVVNISLMIGDRFFGLRGAFAALAGMFALPCVIVLSLTAASAQLLAHPAMAGALRGMGAVAAGLILATGLKLMGSLRSSVLGRAASLALAVATVAAIAGLRWPLIWVVLGLGGLGMLMAWRRIRALEQERP
ncbi:chromate transporter [Pelomonas sp. SE-A7]|uniref:chromate transporter n=1 Tax=Pelomonas sp. SE-A7 TaxID=3054953 RepID=UPI00259CB665|nr:chromate transporter [Pelomonas sp. SE-A7]MDM4764955.1 chromate transporter [Pelomonas sp. SE-A7]